MNQDSFPTKFSDLKGIIGDLGVMEITLKLDVKPVKQIPIALILSIRKGFTLSCIRCLW